MAGKLCYDRFLPFITGLLMRSRTVCMLRFRIGLVLFTLTLIAPILIPPSAALQAEQHGSTLAKNFETKVLVDSKGSIHILWTVPSLNLSGSAPGLWYSKYAPNGSDWTPPTLIRNSSLVQSADMALDRFDRPYITWAEGPAFGSSLPSEQGTMLSQLYFGEINSTTTELVPTVLTGPDSLVLWPSLVVDDNLTAHFVWIQVDSDKDPAAGAYYSSMAITKNISQPILLAAFNRTLVSIPRPRIAFDQVAGDLHVAWVETDRIPAGQVVSSVSYATVDLKWRNVTRLVVAKFNEPLEDPTVTTGSAGSAYVVWQQEDTSKTTSVVYVAQISKSGQIVFLKQLAPPNPRSSTFGVVVSADSQDNLYLVWYQPATPPQHGSSGDQTLANIAYLKLDSDGSLTQSKSEFVTGPLIAVTVSKSGDMYALSQQGIVRVTGPTNSPNLGVIGVTVAAVSALGGAVATEELRYRLLRSVAPISKRLRRERDVEVINGAILRTLCHKPGLTIRDLRQILPDEKPTMMKLATLEAWGHVSSVRIGLRRRFYGSGQLTSPSNPGSITYESIPLRILHEIEQNPGIWEAKLAQTLGLSQQIVHYHLRKLQNTKMITAESIGKRKHYRLPSAHRPNPMAM